MCFVIRTLAATMAVAVIVVPQLAGADAVLAPSQTAPEISAATSFPSSSTNATLENGPVTGMTTSAPTGTDRLIARWIDRLETEIERVEDQTQLPTTEIAAGWTLRLGVHHQRVGQLTARLNELGYLAQADGGVHFSSAVDLAVRTFQADRGLFVDGIVGPQTLGELNRTPRDSLTALHWSLVQMRQLRINLPDELLLINIPSADALLIRDGQVLINMSAAVGRPARQTPTMVDEIVSIVINPRWGVPPTILREDVLPRLRQDGSTGISFSTVLLDGEEVDPTTVDWTGISPYQVFVRQAPGDHNALGRFRFSLTNDQNIYVHDTNHRGVFQRANRAVSSGCIRVEGARWLTEYLLARDDRFSPDRLDRMLQALRTRVLPLTNPLPVYITYWTASVAPDFDVVFHRDIYDMMADYQPTGPMTASRPLPVSAPGISPVAVTAAR